MEKHCPVIKKEIEGWVEGERLSALGAPEALWGKTGCSVCVENQLQHSLKVLHMMATGDKGMLPSMKSKVSMWLLHVL